MKNVFLIIVTTLFIGCVGPSEADHGLVKNMPAIINTTSAFSFILRADNYSSDNTIELSFNLPEGQNLASSLIVTETKGNDTTLIKLEDNSGGEIYKYSIIGDIAELNTAASTQPKKAMIITKNFTGILDWSVTVK
jgi:hypothetical protein|tara:strand:+ start:1029 stop:1436 length:408 start_codon:yes stop_codon:yes gene_type:complete